MDAQIEQCMNLTEEDIAHLRRVEAGLWLAADVSRADILLCCRLSSGARGRTLVVQHAMPKSIPSLYREGASGRTYMAEEQPLLWRTLERGRGGRRQREIVDSGAPFLQDVHPIYSEDKRVIGAFMVETNLIAHERQRRRHHNFRHAVHSLQDMCMRGDLIGADELSRFGQYDDIYLVDRNHPIVYMNGIAANMYRSVGLAVDIQGQRVSELETVDDEIVDEVFRQQRCIEHRHETSDGRVWIRSAAPLSLTAAPFALLRFNLPWLTVFTQRGKTTPDAVLVMVHNVTEAVQKQRELNVKSAIIQEVHHRVKNNLQTIAAILRIQARRCRTQEARQTLHDAVNRILSVSVIHEFLSQDEHRPINIRDLCARIADQLQQVAGNPDQEMYIEIQGPNIRLPAGQATPIALIINELLLNAIEHGLSDRRRGLIAIKLADLGDRVQVAIHNSGRPLPDDFDQQQSQSLGLQIVHTLVQDDLKGELTIESVKTTQASEADERAGADATTGDGVNELPATDGEEPTGEPQEYLDTRAVFTFPKRSLKVD